MLDDLKALLAALEAAEMPLAALNVMIWRVLDNPSGAPFPDNAESDVYFQANARLYTGSIDAAVALGERLNEKGYGMAWITLRHGLDLVSKANHGSVGDISISQIAIGICTRLTKNAIANHGGTE